MTVVDISSLMDNAALAAVTMLVLAVGFAIVLLIASVKLKVTADPKVEAIHNVLPKIDCGACGFAGCASYAKAVAEDPDLLGRCAPGGTDVTNKIAMLLNLQISAGGAAKRPIVHCRSTVNDKTFYARYEGIPTCLSANSLPNVQACSFGCLGFGDCVSVCKFNALDIIDGLAVINYDNCTGCGACIKACPRNIIEMVAFSHENMTTVACKSRENGKTTRSMCTVGCIGCGLCSKQSSLFSITDNLARMDYGNYQPGPAVETAMAKCPTGVIVYRGKGAPAPRPAAQKAPAAT